MCGLSENFQNAVSAAAANVGKVAVVVGSSLMLAGVRTFAVTEAAPTWRERLIIEQREAHADINCRLCRLPRR